MGASHGLLSIQLFIYRRLFLLKSSIQLFDFIYILWWWQSLTDWRKTLARCHSVKLWKAEFSIAIKIAHSDHLIDVFVGSLFAQAVEHEPYFAATNSSITSFIEFFVSDQDLVIREWLVEDAFTM